MAFIAPKSEMCTLKATVGTPRSFAKHSVASYVF